MAAGLEAGGPLESLGPEHMKLEGKGFTGARQKGKGLRMCIFKKILPQRVEIWGVSVWMCVWVCVY